MDKKVGGGGAIMQPYDELGRFAEMSASELSEELALDVPENEF